MTARKEIQKKQCPICKKEKNIQNGFYKTSSPLYAVDGCVPICINCIKNEVVNKDGTINIKTLQRMLKKIDKPWYQDDLQSAYNQYRKEHGFLTDEQVAQKGADIVGLYFKNINSLRQTKNKTYEDSESENFMHQNSNKTVAEIGAIKKIFTPIKEDSSPNIRSETKKNIDTEPLIYSDKWTGKYTESDIRKLDSYYEGLERDYKIVTVNHRDYAQKIAKASLQMDKTFDDMLNGIEGADKKYENATKAFDMLSKSAKFSESTRSVNDVGISSFSKVASMVEAHNWIPTHKPMTKDTIDELLESLATITKSL